MSSPEAESEQPTSQSSTDEQGPPPPPTSQSSTDEQGPPPQPTLEAATVDGSTSPAEGSLGDTAEEQLQGAAPAQPTTSRPQRMTWQSLGSAKRRFNYDIIPKVCVM